MRSNRLLASHSVFITHRQGTAWHKNVTQVQVYSATDARTELHTTHAHKKIEV